MFITIPILFKLFLMHKLKELSGLRSAVIVSYMRQINLID